MRAVGAVAWLALAAGLAGGCGDATLDERTYVVPDATTSDAGFQVTDTGPVQDVPGATDAVSDTTDGKGDAKTVGCGSGAAFCSGKTLYLCKADKSGYAEVSCTQGCSNGKCTENCAKGTTSCKTDTMALVCDANGVATFTPCPKYCQDGKCVDQKQICKPDALFCEPKGNLLLQCHTDGQGAEVVTDCPFGCDTGKLTCKQAFCLPDERRCSPEALDTVEVCLPDQSGWKKGTKCATGCTNGVCNPAACTPGTKSCGLDGIEVCKSDGSGSTPDKPCKYGCAMKGGEPQCQLCDLGVSQCSPTQPGVIEVCSDATVGWQTKTTCGASEACVHGACTTVLSLPKDTTQTQAYALVLEALAKCLQTEKEGVCGAFDTTAVGLSITASNLSDWFCDDPSAHGGEFKDAGLIPMAIDALGCDTFDVEDLTFNTADSAIHPGLAAKECFGFSKGWFSTSPNGREVVVDACGKF